MNPLVVVATIGKVAFGFVGSFDCGGCHAIANVVCWFSMLVLYSVCCFLLFVLAYSFFINT